MQHDDTTEVRQGQDHIINVLLKLKYVASSKGVCFGLAHMAKQALLAGDLETFNKRIKLIYSMPADQLIAAIAENEKLPVQPKNVEFQPGVHREPLLSSIHAFFNGLVLYQYPAEHKEWFPRQNALPIQDGESSANLASPLRLEEVGGFQLATSFIGAYSQRELAEHFSSLNAIIATATTNAPTSFTLSCGNHTIEVGYDGKNGWHIFDANLMPNIISIQNFDDLAQYIDESLFAGRDGVIISSKIYVKNSDAEALKAVFEKWENERSFKKNHDFNDEKKLNLSNKFGFTPLYIAAQNGHGEDVKKLLEMGAKLDMTDSDGTTPLYIAAHNGDGEIVKLLLAHQADVDKASKKGMTPLYIAAQNVP